jgi:hypothetical protein
MVDHNVPHYHFEVRRDYRTRLLEGQPPEFEFVAFHSLIC